MLRKLSYVLGLAIMLSSAPVTGFTQADSTEHHTGVKRTYKKVKSKVRKAASDVKSTTKKEYHKAKNRIKTDDATRDAQENK